jgi:hypothetical protein
VTRAGRWGRGARVAAAPYLLLLLPLLGGAAPAAPTPVPAPAAAAATPAAAEVLHVPRLRGGLVVNAELEGKTAWQADTGNTRNFKDTAGKGMVPYSEAKLRWGGGMLYLMLYAGDLDLEGRVTRRDGPVEDDDAFHLEFGAGARVRVVSVSVLGTVADALCTSTAAGRSCDARWTSGARVAVDRDGTLNKTGDNDEEWVVEMAIPLASLGVAHAAPGVRVPFSVSRCEIARAGRRACGGWGVRGRGELVLDP